MAKRRVLAIGLTGLGVLVIGGIVWSLVSGYVTISFGEVNRQSVSERTTVCGTDIVNRYNEITWLPISDDPAASRIDEEALGNISKDIIAAKDYEQDPTCQTILFWIAIDQGNHVDAQKAYTAVKGLHENNVFASNNIRGNAPLYDWEGEVQRIGPDATGPNGESEEDVN